jgi:hypothetical protein
MKYLMTILNMATISYSERAKKSDAAPTAGKFHTTVKFSSTANSFRLLTMTSTDLFFGFVSSYPPEETTIRKWQSIIA